MLFPNEEINVLEGDARLKEISQNIFEKKANLVFVASVLTTFLLLSPISYRAAVISDQTKIDYVVDKAETIPELVVAFVFK